MKGKKKKKRTHRTSPKKPQPRGYDYGCLPYAMAVASMDFPHHLTHASVEGIAYDTQWSSEFEGQVPTISLVARHADPLIKAFEDFNAWSKETDPDALEVTFVFRKEGGYVLGLSPEYGHLARRCLGYDRVHRPIALGPMWCKKLDSVHPDLQAIRAYCSSSLAPLRIDGLEQSNLLVGHTYLSTPDIRPIPSLRPLLKFDATFIDEDEVVPNSPAWLALQTSSGHANPQQRPSTPDIEHIASQRAKTLTQHFPVTLGRMRRNPSIATLVRKLAPSDVRPWQIEQAVCNLVLSGDMQLGAHFSGLTARKAEATILQAVSSRYEMADGAPLPAYSIDEVKTQVTADGNALLRYLKQKPRKDLLAVQSHLQAASVLEAWTTVDAPGHWSAQP